MRTLEPQDPAATYAAVLDALPVVAYMTNPDGVVTYLSRGWKRFTGHDGAEVLDEGYHTVIHPDDRPRVTAIWDAARAGGLPYRDEFRLRFGNGSYRHVASLADPVHGADDVVIGWFGTLTDINELRATEEQLAAALAAASASARESDARARLVEAGLRALAEASSAMYRSLDFAGTVQNVVDAVARTFASFCTVWSLDADGRIASIAATHADLATHDLLLEEPIARAILRGESTLMETLPDDWRGDSGGEETAGDTVERLDIRSVIVVPIRSARAGRIFGALACAIDDRDPRASYTTEDLRFAEEVAIRAGLALDHAEAYERERRIAMTLQEASLPGVLPLVDHLYLSAAYHPGNSEATIGGDWYDAFTLDDGRVAITIGDVLGNGLNAAVTMGKVRQAMRAVATILPDPNAMLDVADRTVRAVSGDTYATAMAGIFDPLRHTFTFASAGHPGPLFRYPDGRIEELTSCGLLLGLRERGETASVTVNTPPDTALVLYTDGLVEATRDTVDGQRRLHAAVADPRVADAPNPARALVAHVLDGRAATDDVAVLMAEVGPSPRFDELRRTAASRALDRGNPVDPGPRQPATTG